MNAIVSFQRKRVTRPVVLFVAIMGMIALEGCASGDIANRYYGTERYPAKQPEEVELLKSNPNRRFKVIADFQSRIDTPETLRKRAAEIGADAVIVRILGGLYDYREEWAEKDRHNNTYTRIVGTAIKYTPED